MSIHFLNFCLTTPWAMRKDVMESYASLLVARYADKAAFRAEHASIEAARAAPTPRQGAIAVIPVHGTIVQRASQLGMCEGGTSTQDIGRALNAALADTTVGQILLEIDSPGGSVFGVSELADEIRAARGQKPIIAHANSMAASAAYWIGTAADEFYMTPGGQVGSIGVWTAHEDVSKALEAKGVNITLISAGKYKVEGHPFGPLDEEALAAQQSSVDAYYTAFVKAVAKGRNVSVDEVRNGMGQGRVLGASDALKEKMVDGVLTMNELLSKMQKKPRKSALAAASMRARIAAVA